MAGKAESRVPEVRRRNLKDRPVRAEGNYVPYWKISARRTRCSFALDRAIALARLIDRPLIVLEALRAG